MLPTIQTSEKFFCLEELHVHLASFTKKKLSNLAILLLFRPLFSVVTGFSQTGLCQKLRKTVEGSVSEV